MKVYSGDCCMCDVGIPTGEADMHGKKLFSGDIVQLWHGNWIGEECEEWLPSSGLTVITGNQYTSYAGKEPKLKDPSPMLFTMGIAKIGIQNHEWKVSLIKSHTDLVVGERFQSFGINYRD